jgi:PAS domain S-box-containing protein
MAGSAGRTGAADEGGRRGGDPGGPVRSGPERRGDLARSEERFRLLVDSVLDYAIFMLDVDGRVISWNAGAKRLKGYGAEEIIGQHYSAFYPDEARQAGLPARLLEEARTQGRVENSGWRVRRDGSRFWANVVITALRDDEGTLTGFAKVTRDMTAAHLAEEARERAVEDQQRALVRLEELDRWRRDFLGSVIHDLQTPIVVVRGFVELLRDGRIPADERDELTERVLSNIRSLQELVDNLRAYSRLNEPGVELQLEPIDLAILVPGLLADLAPVLDDRPVSLEADPEVVVPADRHGIERVLRNLVVNAVRHTPAGTAIAIRVKATPATGVVEVEDAGDGIDEDLLPRLFERFAARAGGGTGLGLAIVKHYVDLHGGAVEVDSAPGDGAVFRVILPAESAAAS